MINVWFPSLYIFILEANDNCLSVLVLNKLIILFELQFHSWLGCALDLNVELTRCHNYSCTRIQSTENGICTYCIGWTGKNGLKNPEKSRWNSELHYDGWRIGSTKVQKMYFTYLLHKRGFGVLTSKSPAPQRVKEEIKNFGTLNHNPWLNENMLFGWSNQKTKEILTNGIKCLWITNDLINIATYWCKAITTSCAPGETWKTDVLCWHIQIISWH